MAGMIDKTDVIVVPVQGEGPTRVMASVTLGDSFVVHGLRVVESDKGLFVALPQGKDGQGNYRDVAHSVTPEMRAVVSSAVLEGYQQAMERGERPHEKPSRERYRAGAVPSTLSARCGMD